ncbi:outer membrane beta-barrel protein [uncultured Bacteroides sp.]|uniref:outer membrane beta-barrel protein n=1 Tax=uncultured Bacteroides sp. TaxID=162156 RepID=UPI00261532A2|nr:outer membrane beta-barrel protein [uncultured Bacteroides sp.]
MKKVLILFVCLIAFSFSNLNAQSQWSFGPRVGVGFSSRYGDNGYYSKMLGGVFGEYRIKKFATELDVLFTKQGEGGGDYLEKSKCILIPLKFKFYPCSTLGLNIFVGPQLDIYYNGLEGMQPDGSPMIHYQKTSASLTAGLGYRFNFGLDLTFNYNYGLVKLNKDEFPGLENYRDRVFQISLGYDLFSLFKK